MTASWSSHDELDPEEAEESHPLPGSDEMDEDKATTENDSTADMDHLGMLKAAGVPRHFKDHLDEIEELLRITDVLGGNTCLLYTSPSPRDRG